MSHDPTSATERPTTKAGPPRSRARRRTTLAVAALATAGTVAVVGLPTAAVGHAVRARARVARPGTWIALAPKAGAPESGTPTVWVNSKRDAWVLWLRRAGTAHTYQVAEVGPTGKLLGTPADAFAGSHWGSLSNQPTLVGQGGKPLVVFSGLNGVGGSKYNLGCVYGALSGTSPWALQSWSLSADCVNPVGGAAASGSGVLAAAWPGGWGTGHGVAYRVGVGSSIPASGSDQHIGLPGPATAAKASVANDVAGKGHFYVAWTRAFSKPAKNDGYYVKDASGGPAQKAPGSGTTSVNDLSGFGDLAITNTNKHAGVFVAYCSNRPTCTIQLWRVGTKRARAVPHSSGGINPAIAAGPAGRLWVSWYNESKNRVYVTRTNKRDSRFGPVRSYRTSCVEHGLIGLGGGGSPTLVVGLQCLNKKLKTEDFVTHVLAALSLAPGRTSVRNTTGHRLTFTVTDAGDPVAGATVSVAGHRAKTNALGKARITLPRGTKPGHYVAKASARGYAAGGARVTVTT